MKFKNYEKKIIVRPTPQSPYGVIHFTTFEKPQFLKNANSFDNTLNAITTTI
jgi:hypothetical protein